MIQYRKKDGTLGEIRNGPCRIWVEDDSFTISRRIYGYDEYDWEDEEITDIIELRIG